MKKFFSLLLAAGLMLGAFIPAAAGVDMEYTQAIPMQYEDAAIFSEGYAAVKQNGVWGYINESGKALTEFKYCFAAPFSEAKAVVGTSVGIDRQPDGTVTQRVKLSFVDRSGAETPFTVKGEPFISLDFAPSDDMVFYGGHVRLYSKGQPYYFKADGTSLGMSPQFLPTEGKMIFWNPEKPEDGINVTDMQGEILFSVSGKADINGYRTTRIYPFNQGMALADIVKFDDQGAVTEYGYGFINEQGKFVTPPHYREFYRSGSQSYKIFNDRGLASISKNGQFGAIDKSGNVVIPFAYDKLFTFQEGLAPFYKNGKWGAIDVYGNVVIEAKYSALTRFNEGFAIAHDGKRAFIIDNQGKEAGGMDAIDLSAYVSTTTQPDGTLLINSNAPDDMLIVGQNGKYGYVKINFQPPMPTASQLDQWAWSECSAAIEQGIVPASLQNMYRENITREDFAKLLCALIEQASGKNIEQFVLDKTGKKLDNFINEYRFNDCYDREVIAAYALGLANGNDKGGFAPELSITRQEAAALLDRTAKLLSKTGSRPVESTADMDFAADYARPAIESVQQMGIMLGTGNGNFSPLASFSRQQAFMAVYRLRNLQ